MLANPDMMNPVAWVLIALFVTAFVIGPLVVYWLDR